MANEIELPILFPLKGDGPKQAQAELRKVGDAADDAKKKVSGAAKEVDSFGKTVAQGFGLGAGFAVGTKAADALVSVVKSIPDEIGRVVSKASELSNLSGTINASTESLQRMGFMGSLTGTSMESLAGASLLVQRRLEEMPGAFDKWGLSAQRMKDMKPEEQLVAISNAIRAIPEPSRQVAAAYDLMGRSGAANLNLLRKDLGSLLAESDQLGVAMGDELVGQLDDVDAATTKLSAAWEGLRDRLIGGAVAASGADQFLTNLAIAMGAINKGAADNQGLRIWVALIERLAGTGQLKQAAALLALGNERGPGPSTASGTRGAIDNVFLSPDQINFQRILRDAVKLTEDQVKEHDRAADAAKRHAAAIRNDLTKAIKELIETTNRGAAFDIQKLLNQRAGGRGMDISLGDKEALSRLGITDFDKELGILSRMPSFSWSTQMVPERNLHLIRQSKSDTEKMAEAVYQVERAWYAASAALDIYRSGVEATDWRSATLQGAQGGAAAGGSVAGPFGAAFGALFGAVAGRAGFAAGEDDRIRGQLLDQLNAHMESAQKLLAELEKVRQRVREVVTEGAQGLAILFQNVANPEDFERLGRVTLAGVRAMQAQGFSILEIFRAIGPALDAAMAAMERLDIGNAGKAKGDEGLVIRGAFGDLLHFRELVQANEELIASMEGTNAVVAMLLETGGLAGESLQDVMGMLASDYDAAIAAGFTHIQALALQADSLRILNRLQEEGKITLDATTQARIDDAKAAGLLDPTPQEAMKKALDLQLLVLAAIAQMFGVTLPKNVQDYIDALNRIPTQPLPPGTAVLGAPGTVTPSSTPNSNTMGGGVVSAATGFGPRRLDVDTMFLAHAGEHVLIVPAGLPFGFRSAADGFGSGSFKTPLPGGGISDFKTPLPGGGISGLKTPIGDGSGESSASAADVQDLAQSVRALVSRPAINVSSNPTIVVEDKSLVKNRDGQEAFARMVIPVIDRALRLNREGLASRVKQIASAK